LLLGKQLTNHSQPIIFPKGSDMNKDYENEEKRELMYTELDKLMKAGAELIRTSGGRRPGFYNLDTHNYLQEHAWELMFPLEKDQWPDKFQELDHDEKLKWPFYTTYRYSMDVIAPPSIPYMLLNFGYAVLDGKLIICAFFVVQRMVEYQEGPQGMVIDPMALRENKKPSYYIGCPVGEGDIRQSLLRRKYPLDIHVARKGKEEHDQQLYDAYMEAYALQISKAPGWFPTELIKFAKQEGLFVPEQERHV